MKNEFKQKYFTNNFYWVNQENYKLLQEIAISVGCLCHTKKAEIIEWHEGFKNLGFRTRGKTTLFQKEAFLMGNETATDFKEMLTDFNKLSLHKNETIQQKLARLTLVERNSLYKQCDTCKGDATIVVNSTFNENPIYDETENCPNCSTGKVANKEVIEDRMFEYECLISKINDKIKRLHELANEVEEHRYWLRKRL